MTLWQRYKNWRLTRASRRLVYASMRCMVMLAEERFREELTGKEREALECQFLGWLMHDTNAKVDALLSNPERTLHLFLSEVIR